MTDKVQLIKEEIESYKESMKGLEPHSDFRRGQITAYNQIMQFIDSLPEEHNEDLENAAIAYSCANPSERSDGTYDQTDIEWAFEAGAEWQKKKDQETIELAEDHAMLAGMNRMKEEMMKDAVEGEEIWKSIVGFEEYEVSNKGRVLSRKQKLDGVLLKQQTNLVGYKYVTLRDKKYNPHLALVHRLVAEAFIPNPFKKPTVNHIDEDKGNNIVSNLEWATYIEQKNHGSQKRPDVCPSMIDNEGRQSRRLISTRAYLRKCKYIIDDLNMIAYYDDNTHRSKKFEEEKRFYNYKPYNGEKFDRLPFITRPQKTIEVVSDEGVITVYKNISQAAKSLGVSVSLIKRRLDGIGGTSGNFAKLVNYSFKYKE